MKTHYGTCDTANESDNTDYWSVTLCGIGYTESPMSDRIEYVNCKKCLKRYEKQENVVVINKRKDHDCKDELYCDWFKCPSCGDTYIRNNDKYCSNCGSKFKWV